MPQTRSAKKRLRQTKLRTSANKIVRSRMRTFSKRLEEHIEAGEREAARALLPQVQQALDKAARDHVIHRNNASNQKARLARAVARLGG